jgi:hypothetical protein
MVLAGEETLALVATTKWTTTWWLKQTLLEKTFGED